jgi:hypothetical protein
MLDIFAVWLASSLAGFASCMTGWLVSWACWLLVAFVVLVLLCFLSWLEAGCLCLLAGKA